MDDYIKAAILGVVEGLTEFLPVSSTGHMILVQPLLGIDKEQAVWKALLWVSQFGAILAVIVLFWKDLWRRTIQPESKDWKDHVLTKLIVAMVPTIGLALALHDYAEKYLENPPAVGAALIVGAILMLWVDRCFRRSDDQKLEQVTLKQAFWVGAIQCLSMWSGISRSGASIMGGMALGMTPRVATEFSFYLAIPTMLAAAAKTLLKEYKHLSADGIGVILLGTGVSFVVALVVVAGFLKYVRTRRFTPFAVYRVVLGLVVLAWYFGANRGTGL